MMRIVGASRITNGLQLVNVVGDCLFDCEDNSACSNPLAQAAIEIENGGEINEGVQCSP